MSDWRKMRIISIAIMLLVVLVGILGAMRGR